MSPANPHDDRHPADSGGKPDTFEEIVAGWRAEGAVPSWPDSDGDHFVPPEPPPMPRPGRAAAVGLCLLAAGLLLVVAPEVLGIADSVGLTLGLLTMASGLGWLVLRSWTSDRGGEGDGADDGAVF